MNSPSTEVGPGLLAFIVFFFLAVALWLLMRNMFVRLRRMNLAERAEQQRRERIMGKSSISVKVQNLQVQVQGDKAQARFRQDYKADQLSVSSRKTLQLAKVSGQWLIVKESTGG